MKRELWMVAVPELAIIGVRISDAGYYTSESRVVIERCDQLSMRRSKRVNTSFR